jgi:hypothetical protein
MHFFREASVEVLLPGVVLALPLRAGRARRRLVFLVPRHSVIDQGSRYPQRLMQVVVVVTEDAVIAVERPGRVVVD